MNKAVFLDRDGTINIEKEYLHSIEKFEFIPGVLNALRSLCEAGYLLIVITNQSGIGRGYYTEEDFNNLNSWMINELAANNIEISRVYYCPHHPEAKVMKYRVKCKCRKPGLKLFEQAIKDYDIDLEKSYTIGDKIRDCALCETTSCKGFLVGTNEKQEIIERVKKGEYKGVYYAKDLPDAVVRITHDVYY